MKKILLSIFVVGALLATSCKSEKKEAKETVTETVTETTKTIKENVEKNAEVIEDKMEDVSDAIDSALEGITIPKFEDAKVTEYLQGYAEHAKEYIAAKGNVLKNAKLAKKTVELAKQGKEIVSNLDGKAAAQFKSVMSAIQSKMAPSN
ncbi:hypothetical protein [Polaribacter sp.]|uniref:hypothetical protein n=1 Tax=Polaribacter sp. TaxID=1920175 RepID=UPI003EF547A1